MAPFEIEPDLDDTDPNEPIPELNDLEHDPFLSDAEADGDALASAGLGTDEDYGGGCGCFDAGE